MKAVVMAGGEGSRLRPLTTLRPKPMVPIANRPVMEHIILLLKRHGITDIVATLHYRAEDIEAYFGDGSDFGVRLHYTVEETPLGTAGSVKQAEEFVGEGDFLIISGDSLTDLDLGRFVAHHQERQALATLALVRVEQPLEYGVVVTGEDGRITHFIEKPGWSEVRSDTINTGIYCLHSRILKEMEPGRPYDWSADLFPRALAAGEPLYGYLADGYWCDVGSFQSYRDSQGDALNGRVRIELPGEPVGGRMDERTSGREDDPGTNPGPSPSSTRPLVLSSTPSAPVYLAPGARVDPTAVIEGPALIGREARIGPGARISDCSVIGDHCRIGEGARVMGSVLWRGTVVEARAEVSGAIVGANCVLGQGTSVSDGAVIGDRVHLHRGASVAPRVKIWPDKTIQAGAAVRDSIIWGTGHSASLFHDTAVTGLVNVEITPEFAAKLGAAFSATLGNGVRVVTSRDPHPASRMIKRALMSGLTSTGAAVLDLRIVPMPVNGFIVRDSSAAAGVHVRLSRSDPRQVSIEFLDSRGIALSRNAQRKIETVLYREDFRRADPEGIGQIEVLGEAVERYSGRIVESVAAETLRERRFRLVVDCAFGSASFLAPQLLGQLGCDAMMLNAFPDPHRQPRTEEARRHHLERLSEVVPSTGADLGVRVGFDGERLHFVDDRGQIVPDARALAAACLLVFQSVKGATVAVPALAPRAIDALAARYGGRVRRAKNDFPSLMQTAMGERVFLAGHVDGRYIASRFQGATDALAALAQLLELLARQGRAASDILAEVPPFTVEQSEVPCPWDRKGEIMRRLIETVGTGPQTMDGVRVERGDAWALVWPDDADPLFHLYVEATTAEEAAALRRECEQQVAALAQDVAT